MNFSQVLMLLRNSPNVSNLWPHDDLGRFLPGVWWTSATTITIHDIGAEEIAVFDSWTGEWDWNTASVGYTAKGGKRVRVFATP